MRRLVTGLAVLLALLPSAAHASDDELPLARDNGRAGTDNPFEADDVPPSRACDNARSDVGSVIVRKVPVGPVDDGRLAFTSGICIYLPPGYATSGLRYPVLYLLHGGGDDHSDWVSLGRIQEIADRAYTDDRHNAFIVVMPDGTPEGGWFDAYDGRYLNERYMLRYVIPYVDRHFRTIADRRGRVIDGNSNGGYGALHLAAKAPDMFVAAGSMSGNLGFRGDDRAQGGDASPAYKEGNLPAPLAENLDGVDIVMDLGTECFTDVVVDLCLTWAFDQAFRIDNEYFVGRMRNIKHVGALDYRTTEGGHAWRWWRTWLEDRHLPFLLARTADPQAVAAPVERSAPRSPVRYRSVFKRFSVHGWDVRVLDRDVREFLDLRAADRRGFTLRGSGRVRVRTAALYTPGKRYTTSGGATSGAVADRAGRLTVDVDLGPSHTVEDASTRGRVLSTLPDYWTTKRVTIVPAR